jgi:hypothetical protein
VKKLISLFLSSFVFLVLSSTEALAWKFAVASDTQSQYNINTKVLAAIKHVIPNRVAFVMVGDITAQGTTEQYANWKQIITGTYGNVDSGLLPSNWWTSYSTNPPEFFSPAGWHDKGGGGQTSDAVWRANWVNNLPAQVGLSAYATDLNGNPLRGDPGGLFGSTKYDNTLWMWLDDDPKTWPSGMESFMDRTLAKAAADPQITWKFILHHRNAVSCGGGHGDWSQGQSWHNNYFVKYGVDFVINGHNHYYLRNCPMKSATSKTCEPGYRGDTINGDPEGPIHLTSGSSGGGYYNLTCTQSCSQCPWVEKGLGQTRSFMEFDISGGTLVMKMWRVDTSKPHPYLTSSTPYDTFTFKKGPPSPTTPTPTGNVTSTPRPSNTPSPQPDSPGDGNGDGRVDGRDFIIWLSHFGQDVSGAHNGDYDNNGRVRIYDYVIWIKNYSG